MKLEDIRGLRRFLYVFFEKLFARNLPLFYVRYYEILLNINLILYNKRFKASTFIVRKRVLEG